MATILTSYAENGPSTRNWSGILCPEPPSAYYHYDDLLVQAQAMLATRQRNLPMMVQTRDMTGEEAARIIALFNLLVDDLEWIVATTAGQDAGDIPVTEADRTALCAELDNSIDVLGAMFREAGNPAPARLSEQAHDVIAMRWNLDPARGPIGSMGEMHGTALLNFKIRNQPTEGNGQ